MRAPNPHEPNPCGVCKGWGVIFLPGEEKNFYDCPDCGGSGRSSHEPRV